MFQKEIVKIKDYLKDILEDLEKNLVSLKWIVIMKSVFIII